MQEINIIVGQFSLAIRIMFLHVAFVFGHSWVVWVGGLGWELSWAENTGSTVEGSVATVAGNLSPLHFFCMFCDFVFCRVGQVGKSRKHGTTIQAGLRKSRKDWSLPSWALW